MFTTLPFDILNEILFQLDPKSISELLPVSKQTFSTFSPLISDYSQYVNTIALPKYYKNIKRIESCIDALILTQKSELIVLNSDIGKMMNLPDVLLINNNFIYTKKNFLLWFQIYIKRSVRSGHDTIDVDTLLYFITNIKTGQYQYSQISKRLKESILEYIKQRHYVYLYLSNAISLTWSQASYLCRDIYELYSMKSL